MVETTTAPATGDATNDAPKTTKAPATKANATAELKWYKVLHGRINGVWYKDAVPYVQLTEDQAKAYGKDYVNPKGFAECPKEESKED